MEDLRSHPEEQNIFDDIPYRLVQAGSGKRFANYFVDIISFYIVFFIIAFIVLSLNPALADRIPDDDAGFNLVDRLVTLLLYGMYMGIVEALFRGRSIGKLITGTKVVNHDGSAISPQTALVRGLVRAVPFNAFSALGMPCYPWHDKWTKSYVVDIRASQLDSGSN